MRHLKTFKLSGLFKALYIFVIFSWGLFIMTLFQRRHREQKAADHLNFMSNDLNSIEAKIKQIEVDLHKNHLTINLIKKTVRDLAEGNVTDWNKLKKALEVKLDDVDKQYEAAKGSYEKVSFNISVKKVVSLSGAKDMCAFVEKPGDKKPDIQMLDVYESLPFENKDGGVWKQGFPINIDMKLYENQPLKVFVVPHSHNDPGWIKTFDRYYNDQTRNILNLMVDKLEQFPKMRFIYAEMSFFSLWWSQIDDNKKEKVKKLLKEGRFEIVTGGWVMTDEANAHYYAMMDQLIEGNQWLHNQVDYQPQSGWAIDPFGATPTMAYLLKKMGFNSMLIQRTHYEIKKELAKNRNLEFMWRQNWDHTGSTDMLCHMMPFYSYDVPHTCGPDPKTCCQFDFKRLPGGRTTCPWKVPPVAINDANVHQKAETLLEQYRKKAQLFRNNVVLIPLGDDFRYDKPVEWDQQYTNYQKLFDYMNNNKDWKVEAQFGTLTDYFNALYERSGVKPGKYPKHYPALSGDFFSYSDREQHYWTGYFTSRPFYKRLDRVLEHHLRAAEILYSLASATAKHEKLNNYPLSPDMSKLVLARRNLGLYQHHDGITGTAKDFVVVDYGNRMLKSLNEMKTVINSAANFLMYKDKKEYKYTEETVFEMDERRASHDSLPERTVIVVGEKSRPVVFYNSLGHTRTEVKRLYVSQAHIEVKDSNGNVIPTQVSPYWNNHEVTADNIFKVDMVVTVPAFGLGRYEIRAVAPMENLRNYMSKVTFYNGQKAGTFTKQGFNVLSKAAEDFQLENNELTAKFSGNTGMLQSIRLKWSGEDIKTDIKFMKYGTVNQKEKSGAYLFLPDGPARIIPYTNPFIRVIQGPVTMETHVFLPNVEHVVRLVSSPGIDSLSVEMMNLVDIRTESNKELSMRIETSLVNKDKIFYTDLNGLQMQKRKTHSKLPMQANFYPMPTMAYLEDDKYRFTVTSGQSLGTASLEQGWLEIMQDRRLNQDDNRGLGQGVLDNKRTPNTFRLLLEQREPGKPPTAPLPTGYPSLLAQHTSLQHIYPVHILPPRGGASVEQLLPSYIPLTRDLPCEIHLVTLRAMQGPEASSLPIDTTALVLHRIGFNCRFPAKGLQCDVSDGKVVHKDLFKSITMDSVMSTSLSLMYDSSSIPAEKSLEIPPMEINAYKVKLH